MSDEGEEQVQIKFGLAPLTIDTKFTEISSYIVFSLLSLDEVDGSKDQGRCWSHVSKPGAFKYFGAELTLHLFPADLEIKPGRGQEGTFRLPTSASLRLAVL